MPNISVTRSADNSAPVTIQFGEDKAVLAATSGAERHIGYLGKYMVIVSFSVFGAYVAFKGKAYALVRSAMNPELYSGNGEV